MVPGFVLGVARVELHDLLHLEVLVDRDVEGLLNDKPVDFLCARRSREGTIVVEGLGSHNDIVDGPR